MLKLHRWHQFLVGCHHVWVLIQQVHWYFFVSDYVFHCGVFQFYDFAVLSEVLLEFLPALFTYHQDLLENS